MIRWVPRKGFGSDVWHHIHKLSIHPSLSADPNPFRGTHCTYWWLINNCVHMQRGAFYQGNDSNNVIYIINRNFFSFNLRWKTNLNSGSIKKSFKYKIQFVRIEHEMKLFYGVKACKHSESCKTLKLSKQDLYSADFEYIS